MCRKLLRGVLAAVLALSICSTGALAAMPQYPGRLGHCHVIYGTSACADANGDGICDSHGVYCRTYGYGCSPRRQHLCRRPGDAHCTWHYSSAGCWVRCVDADGNGYCDTCGAVCPAAAGSVGNTGSTGSSWTGGTTGSTGNTGSTGSTGNTGSTWTGNGYYGNYGSGCYGGGYCGSGHHSGHHGGHC